MQGSNRRDGGDDNNGCGDDDGDGDDNNGCGDDDGDGTFRLVSNFYSAVSFSLLMCSSAVVIVMYTGCFSHSCFRSKLNNSDDLGRGKQSISFVAPSHSCDNGSGDIVVNALIMTAMMMLKLGKSTNKGVN